MFVFVLFDVSCFKNLCLARVARAASLTLGGLYVFMDVIAYTKEMC